MIVKQSRISCLLKVSNSSTKDADTNSSLTSDHISLLSQATKKLANKIINSFFINMSLWCARQELNLHDCSYEPESYASANSATGAYDYFTKFLLFFVMQDIKIYKYGI